MRDSRVRIIVASLACAVLLSACSESLGIKDYLRQKVEDSQSMLELADASTGAKIASGATVSWPDTIYQDSSPKTFRLTNKGESTITLVGTAPVTIGGGSGQSAFEDDIDQPDLSVLPPGATTEFSLTFAPDDPDLDYACTVIVGSDDPLHPGYSFTASGRSTQWHGSKVVAGPTSDAFFSPQLCVDGGMLYATYALSSAGAIAILGSGDGGRTWGDAFGGSISDGPYPHLTALTGSGSTAAGLHVFYYGNSQVSYNKTLNNSWESDIMTAAATAGSASVMYGDLLLNNGVFLTWYDSATSSLWYNYSRDPRPPIEMEPGPATFQASPIRLTGGSTGRGGGKFHSMKRDSSGNLYLAYFDVDINDMSHVMLLRASASYLGFTENTPPSMGPTAQDGVVLALTESAGLVTVHAVCASDGMLRYSRTRSDDLDTWSGGTFLGLDSHYGANYCFKIDEAGVLYVLHQRHGAEGGIILSVSADSGETWSHRQLDSHSSFSSGTYKSHMALAVSGQTIYAAYTTGSAYPNGSSLILIKSIDGGATW